MTISPQFHFPDRAQYGRPVPKTSIYEHARASNSIRQQFVKEVDKIIWQFKLALETINLPASGGIKEIQVFDLYLKEDVTEMDEAILRTIDKCIIHPVYFRLFSENKVQCAMAWKRPHEGDQRKWVTADYSRGNWQLIAKAEKSSTNLPAALNLSTLYEQLLRSLITGPAKKGESLQQQLARLAEMKVLQQQATKLQNDVTREKQFSRKVEKHGELKRLQQQIKQLSGEQRG